MMGRHEEHGDRPESVNTWLVIPYFTGDQGRNQIDRPLPPGKGASWLCPSIFVDNVSGNTKFRRGVPLRISVEVANWGAGTLPAPALVRLWWSDPTLAFAAAFAIGQTTIIVPWGCLPVRTGDFRVTVPVGASPHVCLLAQVSAPIDGASGVPNPYSDRHWAQLNLVEVTTISGDGTAVLPVIVANPFAHPTFTTVSIEPMSRRTTNRLGRLYEHDIQTDVGGVELQVGAEGAQRIELRPGEMLSVDVTLRFSDPPGRGSMHGFVLNQRFADIDDDDAPTGTLGVLVAPD
jgi:hypothetical protein